MITIILIVINSKPHAGFVIMNTNYLLDYIMYNMIYDYNTIEYSNILEYIDIMELLDYNYSLNDRRHAPFYELPVNRFDVKIYEV